MQYLPFCKSPKSRSSTRLYWNSASSYRLKVRIKNDNSSRDSWGFIGKISLSTALPQLANANASHRLIGLLLSRQSPIGQSRVPPILPCLYTYEVVIPPPDPLTAQDYYTLLFTHLNPGWPKPSRGWSFIQALLVLGVRNFKKWGRSTFRSGGLSNFHSPLSLIGHTA
jgi:hypothetical protein